MIWCKSWFNECFRILRKGGSFYCYGYFKTLAYQLVLLEEIGFQTRQQVIIDKGIRALGGRATKGYQMYPNVTESLLFMIKDSHPFTKSFLKQRQKEIGLTSKEINEALGVKSNGGGMWSIYTGNNVSRQIPTKEMWEKLSNILDFDIQYKKIGITFNIEMGVTDVWNDIDFYEEKRLHPTQKPVALFEYLIKTYTNERDVILDNCMGSGTTAIACLNTNRNYIGFELDEKYFNIAQNRIQNHTVCSV